MKKVKQIDPYTLETIMTYESISEAAFILGLNPSLIHRSCNNPTNTAGGFFFRYVSGPRTGSVRSINTGGKRTVRQFDIHTGALIATFDSIMDAARATGTPSTAISMVCKGKRNQSGGYYWNYITDNTPPKIQPLHPSTSHSNYKRPVEQIDPETGEVIAEYCSITDAASMVKGSSVSNIIDVCTGHHRKTSGGYKWRYKYSKK